MKEIKIFEPAMCCETGLCGVSVDPELLRITTAINTLKENGIIVKRFNLSNAPQAFVENKVVNDFINQYGTDNLPLTLVDDEIRAIGHYPSNQELTDFLEVSGDLLGVSNDKKNEEEGCCCGGGCC